MVPRQILHWSGAQRCSHVIPVGKTIDLLDVGWYPVTFKPGTIGDSRDCTAVGGGRWAVAMAGSGTNGACISIVGGCVGSEAGAETGN